MGTGPLLMVGPFGFCFQVWATIVLFYISAKKNVEAAKLSYDFGTYDRALMYTKQAFFYSTLSFVLGISIYFSAIVGGCLYVFLE